MNYKNVVYALLAVSLLPACCQRKCREICADWKKNVTTEDFCACTSCESRGRCIHVNSQNNDSSYAADDAEYEESYDDFEQEETSDYDSDQEDNDLVK